MSAQRGTTQSQPSAGRSADASLIILVVDDESDLREMLTRSFSREGHRVIAVGDGRAAIDRASTDHFDIILLDVALGPGPNGYDVCRTLRARRNVVPIIMLTALDSEADAVQGLEAGDHLALAARRVEGGLWLGRALELAHRRGDPGSLIQEAQDPLVDRVDAGPELREPGQRLGGWFGLHRDSPGSGQGARRAAPGRADEGSSTRADPA